MSDVLLVRKIVVQDSCIHIYGSDENFYIMAFKKELANIVIGDSVEYGEIDASLGYFIKKVDKPQRIHADTKRPNPTNDNIGDMIKSIPYSLINYAHSEMELTIRLNKAGRYTCVYSSDDGLYACSTIDKSLHRALNRIKDYIKYETKSCVD